MAESIHWLTLNMARGVRVAAILLLAFVFMRILKALTRRLIRAAQTPSRAAQMREQQTRTLAGLAYSVAAISIFAVAVLMALRELGFDITPVEVAGGFASVAVGFGAQNVIKDVINGFFIVLEDQYGVGDWIQANGETGRVEHVTLRRTVLRNLTGALVTIPNSLVGQVANLSRDWSQAFVDVVVPSDELAGRALAVLEKIAGDFRLDPVWSPALLDGPRVLGVESLDLDGMKLRLQVRTAANRQDDVARELRRRIRLGFEEARIPLRRTQRVELQGETPPPAA